MDGDRIEIELVPTDGGAHRSSPPTRQPGSSAAPSPGSPDVLEADTSDVESPDEPSDGQSRTVAIAAGVGLVALLLGWVVGRAGGSDETATEPATTAEATSPPTTEQDDAATPIDTIAPLDESEPLDESGPLESWPPVSRQQNATDLVENGAAISTRDVEIDERLVGYDLRLVALAGIDVAELDLGSGTVSDYVLDGLPRNLSSALIAGDDWIVLPMYDGRDAYVVFDDGTVDRSRLAPDGHQTLYVEGTDRFWRPPSSYFPSGGFELEEVGLDGEPTGRTILLPSNVWPAFADPRGGVIVQSSGRWFTVDEVDSAALGVGELIALDANTLVLNDCVTLDDCGLWRVDRETGTTTRAPIDLERLGTRLLPAAWWTGDPGAGLSPDGRWLAATVERDGGAVDAVLVDLLTGASTDLEGGRPGPPALVWTDDSRFVISLTPMGSPTAYDVETGETFPVVTDDQPVGWNTLTARS